MRFGSVCSGIESASVAWEPLGWEAAWFAEIEPFPSAVLAHRFPTVVNLGDMTKIADMIDCGIVEAPDLLVGGTPCQPFSIAGLRQGLSDARGQLTLAYVELANAIDDARKADGKEPCIVVWENVPGCLTSTDNAFGCFLAGLAGESVPLQPAGRKWSNAGVVLGPQRAIAWRVLDAQYIGLAQRRRRVFVVASARERFDPVELLLEFDGVRRDSAPSRTTGEDLTHDVAPCLTNSGRGVERTGDTRGQDPVVAVRTDRVAGITGARMRGFGDYVIDETASTTKARDHKDATDLVIQEPVAYGLTTEQTPKFNPECALTLTKQSPTGGGQPQCVAYRVSGNSGAWETGNRTDALTSANNSSAQFPVLIPFDTTQITSVSNYSNPQNGDPYHPLAAGAHVPAIPFSSKDYGGDATNDLAPTLRAGGHADSHPNAGVPPAVAYAIQERAVAENPLAGPDGIGVRADDCAYTMEARNQPQAVAYSVALRGREGGSTAELGNEIGGTLRASQGGGDKPHVLVNMAVRRLMPVECERLQGFPDGHTQVPVRGKPAADGPRYKALGNSMAVNVMVWIGRRIVKELRTAEYRNLIG